MALRSCFLLLLLLIGLAGCSTNPPRHITNSCSIFEQKDGWYASAYDSYKKWGVPVYVQLAIIYQESRFVSDAKPPRGRLLWVIPWFRTSSAYGYAQIKDGTWDRYLDATGRWFADRDDFSDVVDFIGWYCDLSHRVLGISKSDAYRQYLAYHEGQGGYRRRTYLKKPWLMRVAREVQARARRYHIQLDHCRGQLHRGWSLWPF
ncbi:MAG: hypothetical protein P8124_03150 [Gammaproteobacteria bacterium]